MAVVGCDVAGDEREPEWLKSRSKIDPKDLVTNENQTRKTDSAGISVTRGSNGLARWRKASSESTRLGSASMRSMDLKKRVSCLGQHVAVSKACVGGAKSKHELSQS